MLRATCSRLIGLAALVTGCASWLPAPTPVHTLSYPAHTDKPARCLLILLPGLGDSDRDFADHGFIAAIRQRKLSVDAIAVNATLGYYARKTLLLRLETDVLAAARKVGYEEIWLGGISMGGMGSLLLAAHHANDFAGVVLIAPYLGDADLIDEIGAAGGITRWVPRPKLAQNNYQRQVWAWLKGAIERPETAPKLYLAAGDRDKLRAGHRLLSTVLPPERVFRTRGPHDWKPWAVLWDDFLDHSDFAAHCREL